jgi:hypothetical protein
LDYDLLWDEDPFPYSDNLHQDFLAKFDDEEVRRALLALPEAYRVPLVLLPRSNADGCRARSRDVQRPGGHRRGGGAAGIVELQVRCSNVRKQRRTSATPGVRA